MNLMTLRVYDRIIWRFILKLILGCGAITCEHMAASYMGMAIGTDGIGECFIRPPNVHKQEKNFDENYH